MLDKVSIRRGRKEDEPFIRDFTQNTFYWGDYVGDAYSQWLTESGDVYVAEVSGRPVGVTHVRYLSPEEAWFEGIRVHPDFRRLGIGLKLTKASIEGAREKNVRLCRAAIDSGNEKSARLAQQFGFRPAVTLAEYVVEFSRLSLLGHTESSSKAYAVSTASLDEVQGILEKASRELHLIGSDFTWRNVTATNIGVLVSEGSIIIAKDPEGRVAAGACTGTPWVEDQEPHNEDGSGDSNEPHSDAPKTRLTYELSSPFGDFLGLEAIFHHVVNLAQREAQSRGVGLGWVFVLCEETNPVLDNILRLGFRPFLENGKESKIDIWELKLD